MSRGFCGLILAAGQGTRFRSEKAKVLHSLLGKSMICLVRDSLLALRPDKVFVVVGYQKDLVAREVAAERVECVVQERQLGTAHAVQAARKALLASRSQDVLIINGDLPLISPKTLGPLLRVHRKKKNALTLLAAELGNPSGFGRLVQEADGRWRVVEEKDASAAQRRIRLVNTGVYVFRIKDLLAVLLRVSNKNRKSEFYLTDIVELLSGGGQRVGVLAAESTEEVVGVNTRHELAQAAAVLRERNARRLSEAGVTLLDPSSTWIDLAVRIGPDTVIYPGVTLEGTTEIGRRCVLYPSAHLVNTRVGNDVKIFGSCVIRDCVLEDGAEAGPFSHLRRGACLRSGARVGNFVEMKNTSLGKGSKALHLSYLGDAEVGEAVNVGAGTITCNYDGVKKNRTTIEDGAFIGSGVELIAPVKVGRGSYIAAGSTITKDVTPGALAVARARQREKAGWAARRKKKR